jgi:hypothetical protein
VNDIVIFETDSHQVEVRLEGDTVWLSQAQMAELFGTSTDNISLHLKNVFKDKELDEPSTTEDFSAVHQEGARQVRRQIKHQPRRHHPRDFGEYRTQRLILEAWTSWRAGSWGNWAAKLSSLPGE